MNQQVRNLHFKFWGFNTIQLKMFLPDNTTVDLRVLMHLTRSINSLMEELGVLRFRNCREIVAFLRLHLILLRLAVET